MTEISHNEKSIFLKFKSADRLAITDYSEELFNKITAVGWSKNGDYVRSSKLKMSLHQLVMEHYYGVEELAAARSKGFIIEHHNNDGFDCQISNLSFAPETQNKAKAFTYDKMREDMMGSVAVNFYKDFISGRYQITIGFNKEHSFIDSSKGMAIPIVAMYFVYNNDFYRTMTDATKILHELNLYGKFDLKSLLYERYHYKEAIPFPTDVPDDQVFYFDENGEVLIRLGTPHLVINQIAEDKDLYKDEG
ncbi:hypothetical protein [Paenibacillus sp. MMO-58]|uniref:hypothetical protein n=1 Tax=Paenibacillus sp. MMO-58 TaxID=3081290 RepID=UPI00301A5929